MTLDDGHGLPTKDLPIVAAAVGADEFCYAMRSIPNFGRGDNPLALLPSPDANASFASRRDDVSVTTARALSIGYSSLAVDVTGEIGLSTATPKRLAATSRIPEGA